MAHYDDRKVHRAGAPKRPALRANVDLQDVLDSLVSRLDSVQRHAFYEKMDQLDSKRAGGGTRFGDRRAKAQTPRTTPWLC